MYAVVKSGGKQLKVAVGETVSVEKLDAAPGSTVELTALLVTDDDKVLVGKDAAAVAITAEVLGHGKADKVVVFKFKKRKGYKKTRGHRQQLTLLKVTDIAVGGKPAKKVDTKVETEAPAEKKPAAKKAAPKAAPKAAAAEVAATDEGLITETTTSEVPVAKRAAAKKPAAPKAEKAEKAESTEKKPAAKKAAAKPAADKPATEKKAPAKKPAAKKTEKPAE